MLIRDIIEAGLLLGVGARIRRATSSCRAGAKDYQIIYYKFRDWPTEAKPVGS